MHAAIYVVVAQITIQFFSKRKKKWNGIIEGSVIWRMAFFPETITPSSLTTKKNYTHKYMQN